MQIENAQVAATRKAAIDALRWVADAAIPIEGGATWPVTRTADATLCDDLYDGTAGILVAFAEAKLTGITIYDEVAYAAAGRLRQLARVADNAPSTGDATSADLTLYGGLSGIAAALRIWAHVSGDRQSRHAADHLLIRISEIQLSKTRLSEIGISDSDLIEGDAGVLVTLVRLGPAGVEAGASALADQIVADARWIDGQPDWPTAGDPAVSMPNFSHGAAGIGFALAAAGDRLGRPDLLAVAQCTARRLVKLGTRADGTLAVPHSVPAPASLDLSQDLATDRNLAGGPATEVSYGWCNGPTGTVRLFQWLDRLQPACGWATQVQACRAAVRASGLPARLYPGFWDNLGQCCGTAGVGEMALDAYQETGDRRWLDWAGELAADVLSRRITDYHGTRWSNTEYRATPPELEPMTGWMQGTAGIAGWLLRMARVHRDDRTAPRVVWPDHGVGA